jgi:transposase
MGSHTHSAFERLEIVETGRRRRWSAAEKRRIIMESLSGPRQVSATARRHGLSRSLLVTWRRAFLAAGEATIAERGSPSAVVAIPTFAAAVITAEPEKPAPAPACASSTASPSPRLEIVLACGRRIIIEGGVDMDAVLKLARGLEALR